MNVLSLFSGAGGLDLGLEAAGLSVVAQCEIDPTARKVLRRHWPFSPLHDDVTTLDSEEFRGRIDLVAGGSPCQDLSEAGRRGGLDGARSGLFWHQCRIADSVAAPWVLWENVAGAFSSNDGADFASVLWGLTGALPDVPDGGWRTAGVVVGPKRTAVWRLLDARWFGVAQRRRRVFVVAGPRGLCGPQVLLEPESLRGDTAPSRAAGAGSTVGTLTSSHSGGWRIGADEAAAGHLIPEFVGTLSPGAHPGGVNGQDAYTGQLIPSVLSFNWQGAAEQGADVQTERTGSLSTTRVPAVAYDEHNGTTDPEVHHTLRAGTKQSTGVLMPDLAVRRLTPRECERLMGWPDDHTRWAFDGSEIADSHRYRMCGNGVVAPVAEWISRRILEAVA